MLTKEEKKRIMKFITYYRGLKTKKTWGTEKNSFRMSVGLKAEHSIISLTI